MGLCGEGHNTRHAPARVLRVEVRDVATVSEELTIRNGGWQLEARDAWVREARGRPTEARVGQSEDRSKGLAEQARHLCLRLV